MHIASQQKLRLSLDSVQGKLLRVISFTGFANFQIGDWVTLTRPNGVTIEATEYSLLIECPWRIIDKEERLVMSDSFEDEDLVRTNDTTTSLRDFHDKLDQHQMVIAKASVSGGMILQIDFESGYRLEAFPCNPKASFHWAIHHEEDNSNIYVSGPELTCESWDS